MQKTTNRGKQFLPCAAFCGTSQCLHKPDKMVPSPRFAVKLLQPRHMTIDVPAKCTTAPSMLISTMEKSFWHTLHCSCSLGSASRILGGFVLPFKMQVKQTYIFCTWACIAVQCLYLRKMFSCCSCAMLTGKWLTCSDDCRTLAYNMLSCGIMLGETQKGTQTRGGGTPRSLVCWRKMFELH